MADLKYVFEVDDKDVLATIKNHQILEKRIASLKGEYAKLDAATNKGKVSIQDYARATQQLDQKIDQLQATLKKGGSGVNQLATGMNTSGKSARNMELQFQQAGYQIQDFIVQVQGGVNPLIAFSQQGSQLAGFFAGPWGAAIGLGIAALSSFAMVMLSTAEDADKAKVSVMSLVDAQKELSKSAASYSNQVDMLKLGVDTEQEVVALKESIRLKAQLGKLNAEYRNTDSFGRRQAIAEEAAVLKTQLYQNQIELNKLALSRAELDTINLKTEARRREVEEYAAIVGEADKLKDSLGQAYLESLGLAQVPLEAGINGAAEAARLLAERLGVSLDKATGLVELAAQQNLNAMKIEFSSGGIAMNKYGSRSTTDTRNPIFGNGESIYPKVSTGGGGRSRVAQIKETTIAIEKETEANKLLEANMNAVSSNMTSAFMAMVEGSDSVVGAFRNMMYNILKSIYEQNVAKPLGNSISSLLFAGLSGGGPQTGSMGLPNFRFADGGVVGSPTSFQMSGGKTGLMGEAGPEAIMPLKRGSNGQLGVQVQGGSAGGTTVNNNITVTGSDAAAVRMEVAKMIPQITNATKAAIIDAKRRGGQMGAAFN